MVPWHTACLECKYHIAFINYNKKRRVLMAENSEIVVGQSKYEWSEM